MRVMSKPFRIILLVPILCILASCIWYVGYGWHYCLVPPSGPNVEIVVSACQSPRMIGVSPDGRYISYYAQGSDGNQPRLLDTLTNERRPDPGCGEWWLTGTIRIGGDVGDANRHGEFWICDLSDGSRVQPKWVQDAPGMITQAADGSESFSPQVLEWFRDAEQVYYVASQRWAVAMSPDFKTYPGHIYLLTNRLNDPVDSVLRFLTDNHIPYRRIGYAGDGTSRVSHNGRFVLPSLGSPGFYASDGARIGPLYDYVQRDQWCCRAYGWASDDSGVYAQGNVIGDATMFALPPPAQPIMKLDLPTAYLTPEAQQTMRNRQNLQQLALIARIGAPILLVAIGYRCFRRARRAKPAVPDA